MRSKWQCSVLLGAISLVSVFMSAQASGPPPASSPSSATSAEWKLVWSDEFNAPNGSPVDTAKWVSETGGGGWGNDELEYYTNRLENAFQRDGNLVIKVIQEKYTGSDGVSRNYTSARLKTPASAERTPSRTVASVSPGSRP